MGVTLTEIAGVFNNEAEAYEYLEAKRWPHGPVCPHCQSQAAHYIEPKSGTGARTVERKGRESKTTTYRRIYTCGGCKKQYSVLVDTIFSDSKIPVHKWLMAIHLMCSGKNGVAAHELSRQLGITVKSAWFMGHRIRYAMQMPSIFDKFAGVVEADETYFGGAAKFMHKADRDRRITGRGSVDKIAVVTLVERGGRARFRVMRRVTGENIGKVLHEHISPAAAFMTDTASVYVDAGKRFVSHETVDHSAGEYVRGSVYTNTVEGYFSQLKRSVDGTHHHVTEQHLDRYLAEFDWRYSSRKMVDADRTELTIRKTAGKRLTYG